MKYLSICIPTYEMNGYGTIFLKQSLDILTQQTCTDFEVIISDHSQNNEIEELCKTYSDKLTIRYYRNSANRGSSSANLNNAIKKATGVLIKILFQDDFLFTSTSLAETIAAFDIKKDHWLVSACEHSKDGKTFYKPFFPTYNRKIHLGENTISSPSVLTIRNQNPLLFDEKLLWLMDCDYYKRLHKKFGRPKILRTITVVNRVGGHQVSQTIVPENLQLAEKKYVIKKFKSGFREMLELDTVTLVAVSSIKLPETINALKISLESINYKEALLISHEKPTALPSGITFKQGPHLKSIDEYSRFMLYELEKYIDTPHVLVVQYDGYVLRADEWRREFLEYDYIGAPWPPKTHRTPAGTEVRVGNGGFSLRSKKLLGICNTLGIPFTDNGTGFFNEDGVLCNYYRKELEAAGICFAAVSVASKFSRETTCSDSYPTPFGFHKNKKLIPLSIVCKRFLRKHRILK